ncbi:hypothetical protein [Nocardia wallacei]|uniref:hypothetical protein n=1 Tax=Nocardia wallacei TaxID=480035 RepID=UPI002458FD40|nr:hypothetical protein [Nocardia wallacei]
MTRIRRTHGFYVKIVTYDRDSRCVVLVPCLSRFAVADSPTHAEHLARTMLAAHGAGNSVRLHPVHTHARGIDGDPERFAAPASGLTRWHIDTPDTERPAGAARVPASRGR